MRVYALYALITFLSVRAYRDYFLSLCALVALAALTPHPDWPTSVLGIQGANPWNLLLLNVFIAWWQQRKVQGLKWDMPGYLTVLLVAYGAVMALGSLRLFNDLTGLEGFSKGYLVSEYLVNTYKWVVPALMLYDSCRTPERLKQALLAIFTFYVVLALLVIRWMPPQYLVDGETMERRSLKVLVQGMGWHRVNLSAMLAGASWALLTCTVLWRAQRRYVVAAAGVVLLGQALTAGRMGYIAWAGVGFCLSVLRWRRYLVLVPIVPLLIVLFVPSVAQRMMQGVSTPSGKVDTMTLTASRTLIWPYVIDKITQRPFLGYGREAMIRTKLTAFLKFYLNEEFAHPHNAYLQWLFDNGLLGAIPVAIFFLCVLWQAFALTRVSDESGLYLAIGGTTLALILAHLLSSFGSQTFYPREGAVPFWVAMMLTVRATRMRAAAFVARPSVRRWRGGRAAAPSPAAAEPAAAAAPAAALSAPRLRPGQRPLSWSERGGAGSPGGPRGPGRRF
jgi:O-antigen ligase